MVLAGFFFLLGLFVAELAEVHQAADGWNGVGGNFNEIHSLGAGEIEGFAERQDAQLIMIRSDDPDFAGTNLAVDPDKGSGRRRTWSKRATQDTPVRLNLFMQLFSNTQTGTMPGQ
jgi:hypothetical protein